MDSSSRDVEDWMAKLAWMRQHGVLSASWSFDGALASASLGDVPPPPPSPADEAEPKPQHYVMRRRGSAVPGLREVEGDADDQ